MWILSDVLYQPDAIGFISDVNLCVAQNFSHSPSKLQTVSVKRRYLYANGSSHVKSNHLGRKEFS